jgi:hypothetical protein
MKKIKCVGLKSCASSAHGMDSFDGVTGTETMAYVRSDYYLWTDEIDLAERSFNVYLGCTLASYILRLCNLSERGVFVGYVFDIPGSLSSSTATTTTQPKFVEHGLYFDHIVLRPTIRGGYAIQPVAMARGRYSAPSFSRG